MDATLHRNDGGSKTAKPSNSDCLSVLTRNSNQTTAKQCKNHRQRLHIMLKRPQRDENFNYPHCRQSCGDHHCQSPEEAVQPSLCQSNPSLPVPSTTYHLGPNPGHNGAPLAVSSKCDRTKLPQGATLQCVKQISPHSNYKISDTDVKNKNTYGDLNSRHTYLKQSNKIQDQTDIFKKSVKNENISNNMKVLNTSKKSTTKSCNDSLHVQINKALIDQTFLKSLTRTQSCQHVKYIKVETDCNNEAKEVPKSPEMLTFEKHEMLKENKKPNTEYVKSYACLNENRTNIHSQEIPFDVSEKLDLHLHFGENSRNGTEKENTQENQLNDTQQLELYLGDDLQIDISAHLEKENINETQSSQLPDSPIEGRLIIMDDNSLDPSSVFENNENSSIGHANAENMTHATYSMDIDEQTNNQLRIISALSDSVKDQIISSLEYLKLVNYTTKDPTKNFVQKTLQSSSPSQFNEVKIVMEDDSFSNLLSPDNFVYQNEAQVPSNITMENTQTHTLSNDKNTSTVANNEKNRDNPEITDQLSLRTLKITTDKNQLQETPASLQLVKDNNQPQANPSEEEIQAKTSEIVKIDIENRKTGLFQFDLLDEIVPKAKHTGQVKHEPEDIKPIDLPTYVSKLTFEDDGYLDSLLEVSMNKDEDTDLKNKLDSYIFFQALPQTQHKTQELKDIQKPTEATKNKKVKKYTQQKEKKTRKRTKKKSQNYDTTKLFVEKNFANDRLVKNPALAVPKPTSEKRSVNLHALSSNGKIAKKKVTPSAKTNKDQNTKINLTSDKQNKLNKPAELKNPAESRNKIKSKKVDKKKNLETNTKKNKNETLKDILVNNNNIIKSSKSHDKTPKTVEKFCKNQLNRDKMKTKTDLNLKSNSTVLNDPETSSKHRKVGKKASKRTENLAKKHDSSGENPKETKSMKKIQADHRETSKKIEKLKNYNGNKSIGKSSLTKLMKPPKKSAKMVCSVPLIRLTKEELRKYSNNKENINNINEINIKTKKEATKLVPCKEYLNRAAKVVCSLPLTSLKNKELIKRTSAENFEKPNKINNETGQEVTKLLRNFKIPKKRGTTPGLEAPNTDTPETSSSYKERFLTPLAKVAPLIQQENVQQKTYIRMWHEMKMLQARLIRDAEQKRRLNQKISKLNVQARLHRARDPRTLLDPRDPRGSHAPLGRHDPRCQEPRVLLETRGSHEQRMPHELRGSHDPHNPRTQGDTRDPRNTRDPQDSLVERRYQKARACDSSRRDAERAKLHDRARPGLTRAACSHQRASGQLAHSRDPRLPRLVKEKQLYVPAENKTSNIEMKSRHTHEDKKVRPKMQHQYSQQNVRTEKHNVPTNKERNNVPLETRHQNTQKNVPVCTKNYSVPTNKLHNNLLPEMRHQNMQKIIPTSANNQNGQAQNKTRRRRPRRRGKPRSVIIAPDKIFANETSNYAMEVDNWL